MRAPFFVEFPKGLRPAEQRSLHPRLGWLLPTPAPQFLDGSVEEDGWNLHPFDQPGIRFVDQCPPAQRYHPCAAAAAEIVDQFPQGFVLHPAKFGLSRLAKDLRDGSSVALFNPLIEIYTAP